MPSQRRGRPAFMGHVRRGVLRSRAGGLGSVRVRAPSCLRLIHSFRGSTYMSDGYAATCARLGLRRSASRTGCCLDNAVAESIFASLKAELDRRHLTSRAQARRAVSVWINYYNHRRIHTSCGNRPPVEHEQTLTIPDEPIGSPLTAWHRCPAPGGKPRSSRTSRRAGRECAMMTAS